MASFNTILKIIGGGVAGAFFYHFFTHDNEQRDDNSNNNNNNSSNINLRNSSSGSRNRITSSSSGSQSQLDYAHNLIDLLQNTLIEYILCDETSHVITIDSQATLDYALMRMNESNVTSLPVVDLQHKKYIGMLSIIDICSFLGQFTNSDSPNTPVGDVLKYNREPFLPLYVNSPIQLLIHIMTHVPQVPIYASSSETIVVDIVSRLNVIKFIHENIEDLGLKSNASIKSLGLLSKQICSIDSDSRVIDAINLLNSEQVTELAVINKEGKLIGTFSASDLRKLSIYTFNQCYEPINKFIKLDQDQLIIVSPSSSLSQTIKKFVENNAQICWLVDNQMKPISSITQLSLMKYFLNLSTSFIE